MTGETNEEVTKKELLCQRRGYQREEKFLRVKTKAGWKVCVRGEEVRWEVLKQYYGHVRLATQAEDRRRLAVHSLFWWPRMAIEIESLVKACVQCKRGKSFDLTSGGL